MQRTKPRLVVAAAAATAAATAAGVVAAVAVARGAAVPQSRAARGACHQCITALSLGLFLETAEALTASCQWELSGNGIVAALARLHCTPASCSRNAKLGN
eukprot:8802251-Alexandrium_andersonii.AAC.1